MHASHLVWRQAAILILGLGAAGVALGQTDTYLALQTNAAGLSNAQGGREYSTSYVPRDDLWPPILLRTNTYLCRPFAADHGQTPAAAGGCGRGLSGVLSGDRLGGEE